MPLYHHRRPLYRQQYYPLLPFRPPLPRLARRPLPRSSPTPSRALVLTILPHNRNHPFKARTAPHPLGHLRRAVRLTAPIRCLTQRRSLRPSRSLHPTPPYESFRKPPLTRTTSPRCRPNRRTTPLHNLNRPFKVRTAPHPLGHLRRAVRLTAPIRCLTQRRSLRPSRSLHPTPPYESFRKPPLTRTTSPRCRPNRRTTPPSRTHRPRSRTPTSLIRRAAALPSSTQFIVASPRSSITGITDSRTETPSVPHDKCARSLRRRAR